MEKPASEKIKYTGPVCLNSRSINSAVATINGFDSKNQSLKDKPLSFNELVSLLNFLEVNVMSTELYFDGTIPNKFKSQTLENIASVKKWELNRISSIELNSKAQLLEICKSSAEQASQLMMNIDLDDIVTNRIDKPTDKYIEFESKLKEAYENPWQQESICDELAEEIFSTGKGVHGGKCIVGIISSEVENVNLLKHVVGLFEQAKEDTKPYLVGALINRFRANYVNKLSSQDEYEAAFLIDPSMEALHSQQVFLLWKYLLDKMKREYSTHNIEVLNNLFASYNDSFPIGFAALLHPKTKDLESLMQNARDLKNDVFNKLVAEKSDQNRYFHDFTPEEFKLLQEELLGVEALKLENYQHKTSNLLLKCLPEIVGIGADVALTNFMTDFKPEFDKALQIVGGSAGMFARKFAKKGLELILPTNRYNVFVGHREDLAKFYEGALSSSSDIKNTLGHKIERVFDRKLVLAG